MNQQIFKLVLMEDASRFLDSLNDTVYEKIDYNIRKVAAGFKDSELFKKLKNSEIWEFRTLYGGMAYRLFAFWDTEEDALVVATHGLVKKTQKTPPNEIAKAERIRQQYFEHKKREKWKR